MGLIRKTASVSTLGLIDFRSDKERTAAYTRGVRKHSRRAASAAKQQAKAAERTANLTALTVRQQTPQGPPAGWYPDPSGQPVNQWWDGTAWSGHVQP